MFDTLNSRAYTVADLKAIAERMQLTVPSKANKAAIAQIIADAIDLDHGYAIEMNADYDRRKAVTRRIANGYLATVAASSGKTFDARMYSRMITYARQNGYTLGTYDDILPYKHFTPKQWRRANKKWRAEYARTR